MTLCPDVPDVPDVSRARAIAERHRLEGIIRSAMEAIITVDEREVVVLFNAMAERLFGLSATQAIGGPLARFIPPRFRPGHADKVRQFGVTGVSERRLSALKPLYGLRADGSEFPIEASISQFTDGQTKLYTVMLRDITDRLKAEAELTASRNQLRALSASIQTAREEEKARIARELHDDLGQRLTALKMDISLLESDLEEHAAMGSWRSQTQAMRQLIDDTVNAVRGIASDLRPVMLDDLGLMPAIDWLANEWRMRHGIVVKLDIGDDEWPFTRDAATSIYRIIQEALTNVVRHANATRVGIRLWREASENLGAQVILRIDDNGVGCAFWKEGMGNATETGSRGMRFGLIGMRERARLLGGELTLQSPTEGGCVVQARLPASILDKTP